MYVCLLSLRWTGLCAYVCMSPDLEMDRVSAYVCMAPVLEMDRVNAYVCMAPVLEMDRFVCIHMYVSCP